MSRCPRGWEHRLEQLATQAIIHLLLRSPINECDVTTRRRAVALRSKSGSVAMMRRNLKNPRSRFGQRLSEMELQERKTNSPAAAVLALMLQLRIANILVAPRNYERQVSEAFLVSSCCPRFRCSRLGVAQNSVWPNHYTPVLLRSHRPEQRCKELVHTRRPERVTGTRYQVQRAPLAILRAIQLRLLHTDPAIPTVCRSFV